MPALKNKTYTTDYIYALPDGERAELIDGKLYEMPFPNTRHQQLVGKISCLIRNYLDEKNIDDEAFFAPFAVFLENNDITYVEPDISVICDKSKLDDYGCNGAPDWIIEIVMPESRNMDYYIKLFRYAEAGVREYWIVDSVKNRIIVYNFETEDVLEYTFADKVKAGIYEDLEIDFTEIKFK